MVRKNRSKSQFVFSCKWAAFLKTTMVFAITPCIEMNHLKGVTFPFFFGKHVVLVCLINITTNNTSKIQVLV